MSNVDVRSAICNDQLTKPEQLFFYCNFSATRFNSVKFEKLFILIFWLWTLKLKVAWKGKR